MTDCVAASSIGSMLLDVSNVENTPSLNNGLKH